MGTKLVKRDLFAAEALGGLISAEGSFFIEPQQIKHVAELAYQFADAMMIASELRNQDEDCDEDGALSEPSILQFKRRNGTDGR